MYLDKVITSIVGDLGKKKEAKQRMMLQHELNRLTRSVAISVRKKEADDILDVYKSKLYNFSYPFGDYATWIEIGDINYLVLPPDETWPHYQIYLNHKYTDALYIEDILVWAPDGRIGPHRDRPGGYEIGPTVYAYQNSRCAKLNLPKDELEIFARDAEDGLAGACLAWRAPDGEDVIEFTAVDPNMPDWIVEASKSYACRLFDKPGYSDNPILCPYHDEFWDAALLPISIIIYIATAPVRELDTSWQPKRIIGSGSKAREKRGYYQLTPIKKHYFHKRIQRYIVGESRELAVPHFVRGHERRSHERHLRSGRVTQVRECWVNPHWVGEGYEELPPHYSLNWFNDERIESVKKLRKGNESSGTR